MKSRIFIVLVCVVLCTSIALAATPNLINYQGRLTNPGGTPLAGTFSVLFSIYTIPTGGTSVWQETQSVTTDAGGLFAVTLGTVSTLYGSVFNDSTLYLGVKIGADPELIPRVQFVSCPYSLRVSTVHGASGGIITGTVIVNGTTEAEAPAGSFGIWGNATGSSTNQNVGVYGVASNSSLVNLGVWGIAHDANGSTPSAGIFGSDVSDFGGTVWAGYFSGWANVTGNFYSPAKFFKIDDPIDPANRTLQHACVESNEFKNMYDGVVTTDASGNATVTLPTWFGALNKDFRYQLTVIGQFAQAIVSNKVSGSSFSIRTDKPNVEVSWLLTGVRKDAYVMAHPFEVEQDKPAALRGQYLHPIENGVDEKLGVDYATRQLAVRAEQQAAERKRVVDTNVSSKK